MIRGAVSVGLLIFAIASPAGAAESTAAKLTVAPEPGKPSVEVWVTRSRGEDGSVTLKLIAKGVGPKPQALTVYSGGGDDDGAGDADLRTVTAGTIDLPGGRKIVRVDFTYHPPDGKKHDERTETTLVGFDKKTHKLLELTTRTARDRSKICRESYETALFAEAVDGGGVNLVAATSLKLESALGDDDLPLDKACRAGKGAQKKLYKWAGEKFVDPDAIAPSADGGTKDED